MNKMYMIHNPLDGFWSNYDGWTTRENADIFSEDERRRLNLPIGGRWVEVDPRTREMKNPPWYNRT